MNVYVCCKSDWFITLQNHGLFRYKAVKLALKWCQDNVSNFVIITPKYKNRWTFSILAAFLYSNIITDLIRFICRKYSIYMLSTNHCVMIYYYLGTWEKWSIVIAWQTANFCLVTPLVASTLSKIVIYNDLFVVILLEHVWKFNQFILQLTTFLF